MKLLNTLAASVFLTFAVACVTVKDADGETITAAQVSPALEQVATAHEVSSTLAVMFQSVAHLDPGYRALAVYFQGRAEAFAEAYFMLTGGMP